MHTEMWEHPATVENVATLRRRGAVVLEPATGRLTGADTGKGRLPEPAEIAQLAELLLHRPDALPCDLAGRHVVVSAGGTREAARPGPVPRQRLLGPAGLRARRPSPPPAAPGSPSSPPTSSLPDPAGVDVVRVTSAEDLRDAVHKAADEADVVVMAAAVADFRPRPTAEHKIKKSGRGPAPIELDREPRRAGRAGRRPPARAGAGRLRRRDRRRQRPACSSTAAPSWRARAATCWSSTPSGRARRSGRPDNAAVILGRDGTEVDVPSGPKAVLAAAVWDAGSAGRAGRQRLRRADRSVG